ncbi:hypothetical protein ONS96_000982 [Cadophora gregata f. sp. sojae]|nr:hypothetical protein ONS96_000982 [Cadophora gregata f. sp. sojae]
MAKDLQIEGTIAGLEKSAEAGCKTCAILFSGLNLPEIRHIRNNGIRQAMECGKIQLGDFEEGRTRIEVMWGVGTEVERVVVRTGLPEKSTYADRRYFNFGYQPSARPAGCRVFPILESFPVSDTRSKESYAHLKRWIDLCDGTHKCTPKTLPLLPKRVLKISGDSVRLYLRPHEGKARYTTLSHTWGSNTNFTLTIDKEGREGTLNSFLKDIPWMTIPKTFQDAIIISRELDIEYLWIDSLCIIQNDKQDWEEQSREMRPIYGNSWLNIAATDSKDSRGGCFRICNADQTHPLQRVPEDLNIVIMDQPVNTHKDFGTNYRTDSSSPPLLQRGWVFQERVLPSRVIYYTKDELRWECNEMADCQCGGMVVLARFKPYYYQSLAGLQDPLPFVWMKMIERYSWLRFTYPEKDRMIALAGVAKEVLDHGGAGDYLAGHWRQDLSLQLCWTVIDNRRRPTQYFAPSWSWLSVLGSIEHSKIEFRRQRRPQIDVQITDASCQPSGGEGLERVTSGMIIVTGKILHLNAEAIHTSQDDRPRYRLWHQNSSFEYSDFRPDSILDSSEAIQITSLSVLFWGKIWVGTGGVAYQNTFMVLRAAGDDGSGSFQRLGIFSLPDRQEGPGATLAEEFVSLCLLMADIRII